MLRMENQIYTQRGLDKEHSYAEQISDLDLQVTSAKTNLTL